MPDQIAIHGIPRTTEAAGQTMVQLQRVAVSFEYPVVFTRGLFDPANPVFAEAIGRCEPDRRHRFAVFVDSGVAAAWPGIEKAITAYAAHHGARLKAVAPPEVVPGGEEAKNKPEILARVLSRILELGIDRQSVVIAIGGGAVLDMVGFAAATAHRGVRILRVPTTVLTQADSGVGVKNGVNHNGLKNAIGAFQPPFAVLNDFDFLKTLSPRDGRAGLVEAVKGARGRDPDFFCWRETTAELLAAFAPATIEEAVRRSAQLHMRHIANSGDPFEFGAGRPLDFGHWAAHRLEALSGYGLRHGEAVAIGVALDTRLSVLHGLLSVGQEARICRLLERLGLRLWHRAMEEQDDGGGLLVLDGLREFREHLGGDLSITLLTDLGHGIEWRGVDMKVVIAAISWLRRRDAQRQDVQRRDT
jgi:3-dehydroquinate synthase